MTLRVSASLYFAPLVLPFLTRGAPSTQNPDPDITINILVHFLPVCSPNHLSISLSWGHTAHAVLYPASFIWRYNEIESSLELLLWCFCSFGNAYSLQQNQTIQISKKEKKKESSVISPSRDNDCRHCAAYWDWFMNQTSISVVEIYCQLVEGCAEKVCS